MEKCLSKLQKLYSSEVNQLDSVSVNILNIQAICNRVTNLTQLEISNEHLRTSGLIKPLAIYHGRAIYVLYCPFK